MRVEAYLQSLGRAEVSSRVVGDMVIEGLKNLDPIAYIRYAIVYLGLEDLASVRAEIDKLLSEQQGVVQPLPNLAEEELLLDSLEPGETSANLVIVKGSTSQSSANALL